MCAIFDIAINGKRWKERDSMREKQQSLQRHFHQKTSTTTRSVRYVIIWERKNIYFCDCMTGTKKTWGRIRSRKSFFFYFQIKMCKYMSKLTVNSRHAMWQARSRYLRLLSIWFYFLSKYEHCVLALDNTSYQRCFFFVTWIVEIELIHIAKCTFFDKIH